jgi:hypothetical protein
MDINVNMVSLGYAMHAIERRFVLKYMSTIELIMGVETLVYILKILENLK